MKTTRWLLALVLFAFIALPFAVFAADVTPVVSGDTTDALRAFLYGLTEKYPWVITALTVLGIIRLVVKPVMSIIETVVASTPSTKDDEFLAKWQASAAYRWFLYVLDWLGSVKSPSAIRTTGTTNPLAK